VGSGQYYMLDAGSRNGTYINKQRISTPTLLHHGDRVSVGKTRIVFLVELSSDAGRSGEATEVQDNQAGFIDSTLNIARSDIRPVTILVADIRNFSILSKKIEIAVLSKLMSKWFYEVQNVIGRRYGWVDKFVGDCVMALWDMQKSPHDMIMNCLGAALDIRSLTRELGLSNPKVARDLKIGVGIHTGTAALGIGKAKTAMGEAVNLAFRLESATKDLGKEVVLSSVMCRLLPERFWKGKEREVLTKAESNPVRVAAFTFKELSSFLESKGVSK